jgi:hypothetical protein
MTAADRQAHHRRSQRSDRRRLGPGWLSAGLEYGRFEVGISPGSGRLLRIDLVNGERTDLLTGLTKPATVLPLATGGYVVTQMGGPVLRLTPP